MSIKQINSRKRNWWKFTLMGVKDRIQPEVATQKEKDIVKEITRLFRVILDEFDESNEELGFRKKTNE